MSHMAAHANINLDYVKEALSKLNFNGSFFIGAIDLGRVIGKDTCVSVTPEDDVRLLYRKGRDGRTPIVLGKEAEDTTLIVVGVCTDDDGLDTIFTAFYGQLAPKEPWDPRLRDEEREESEAFWASHALVYDKDSLDEERNA